MTDKDTTESIHTDEKSTQDNALTTSLSDNIPLSERDDIKKLISDEKSRWAREYQKQEEKRLLELQNKKEKSFEEREVQYNNEIEVLKKEREAYDTVIINGIETRKKELQKTMNEEQYKVLEKLLEGKKSVDMYSELALYETLLAHNNTAKTSPVPPQIVVSTKPTDKYDDIARVYQTR